MLGWIKIDFCCFIRLVNKSKVNKLKSFLHWSYYTVVCTQLPNYNSRQPRDVDELPQWWSAHDNVASCATKSLKSWYLDLSDFTTTKRRDCLRSSKRSAAQRSCDVDLNTIQDGGRHWSPYIIEIDQIRLVAGSAMRDRMTKTWSNESIHPSCSCSSLDCISSARGMCCLHCLMRLLRVQ